MLGEAVALKIKNPWEDRTDVAISIHPIKNTFSLLVTWIACKRKGKQEDVMVVVLGHVEKMKNFINWNPYNKIATCCPLSDLQVVDTSKQMPKVYDYRRNILS
ncbi:hypothetical protein MUG91_G40n68 [Manis pentadactyla]|nr:hypothetical protein MUG91_G40n68 [Manis pentadactyla]